MDPLLKDWITIGFSSAALIISCASFILSWRNFRRDRSHLKLTLEFEGHRNQDGQYKVTITNDGRRSAILTEVDILLWFQGRHNIYHQDTDLAEGKQKVIYVPLAMVPSVSNPLRIRAFEARDSVRHTYRKNTLKLLWKVLTTRR